MMERDKTTWAEVLNEEQSKPYFKAILDFLKEETRRGTVVYPPAEELFSAFNETPYEQLKVVILGQDPYHGPNQAHGLSFSVKPGVKPPPSLKNIFQELKNDLDIPIPHHGCLKKWANQGVLLLNTSLSVEENKPQSHAKIGWTQFTDTVMKKLNDYPQPLVFLLWGAHAKSKGAFITNTHHLVLTAAHPSPLSVYQGFYGCKHFSTTNEFLKNHGRKPIDWALE